VDDFAKLPAGDRDDLFRTVASRRGLSPAIIEKDFWVCWTLKRVFSVEAPPAGLLFKGGTSLSKVYKVIERFSEDIDLSFDRGGLGFTGQADPLAAASGKKHQRALQLLSETCREVIPEEFLPQLSVAFDQALAGTSSQRWTLALAGDDPDQQTLVFQYPSSTSKQLTDEPAYIRRVVRLELGARSEHWPAVNATVTPYVAEDFPATFRAPDCRVHVLAAERTFWEKVTILHAWYHAPADKVLRDRQSRHYYDVSRMYEHGIGRKAMKDTSLLIAVAKHKEVFFPAAWASYREAKPGTIRIVPPESRMGELRRDYQGMQEMIFGEPPPFDHMIEVLREIEAAANAA
jgi:hypothetical protein